MRQFKATQITPQYGPMSLYVRFIGKLIFMKGQNSTKDYVNKIVEQMKDKGAIITYGNGGWIRIDIVRDLETVKLGDYEITQDMDDGLKEDTFFEFYKKKYSEAKFVVQEIIE